MNYLLVAEKGCSPWYRPFAYFFSLLLVFFFCSFAEAAAITPQTAAQDVKLQPKVPIRPDLTLEPQIPIKIFSPGTGTVWRHGRYVSIAWQWKANGLVTIKLMQGTKEIVTIANPVYTGKDGMGEIKAWKVPLTVPVGEYTIEISSYQDPAFVTKQKVGIDLLKISVIEPRLNTQHYLSSPITAVWTFDGYPETVNVDLVTPEGYSYSIKSSVPAGTGGAGRLDGVVPSEIDFQRRNGFKVRVTAPDGAVGFSPEFIVDSTIVIPTSPKSVTWYAPGTKIPVRWDYMGNIGPFVRITVSDESHRVWQIIDNVFSGQNGKGAYDLEVPRVDKPTYFDIFVENKQVHGMNTGTVKIRVFQSAAAMQSATPMATGASR